MATRSRRLGTTATEAIREGDPELASAAATVHLSASLTTILAELHAHGDLQEETSR